MSARAGAVAAAAFGENTCVRARVPTPHSAQVVAAPRATDLLQEFDELSRQHETQTRTLKRAAMKAKRDVEDAELEEATPERTAELRSSAEEAARAVRQVSLAGRRQGLAGN